MAATALKINSDKQSMGRFYRIPLSLYKEDNTPSATAVLGIIYTFDKPEGDKCCRLSYEQVEKEIGITKPTIAKAFACLKSNNKIKTVNRDKDGTSYKFIGDIYEKKYDIVPQYLYTAEIYIEGKYRTLTNSEIRVLAHMMTASMNPKSHGCCRGSARQFAVVLGLSEKTIRIAIRALMKAGLIYRPSEDKGVNKHKLSVYHVNKSLFDYKKYLKIAKKKEEKLSAEVQAANARAERERFYAQRQEEQRRRLDRYINKANENQGFRLANARLNRLEFEIAQAETYNPLLLPAIQAEQALMRSKRAESLQQLHMTESDLELKYFCKKCKDTGFMPDGKGCDCYKKK